MSADGGGPLLHDGGLVSREVCAPASRTLFLCARKENFQRLRRILAAFASFAAKASDSRRLTLPVLVSASAAWLHDDMTSPPYRQTRAQAPLPPYTPKPAPRTLEEAGILPGSRLLATPEEVAEQERVESERLAVQNAHLDGVLASLWSCNCCRTGNAMGSASGLCGACSVVAAQLRAERVMNDDVNGQSRRELVEQYLAAQP